jgi:hypothetical protein
LRERRSARHTILRNLFNSTRQLFDTERELHVALTSEQIASILSGLDQTRAATAVEKRRRAPRVKDHGVVKIVPYADGVSRAERTAIMVDFSSRGVAIRCAEPLPSGAHFVLVLQKNPQQTVRLLCAVAHCRKLKDRDFQVGAEFVGLAPADPSAPVSSATMPDDPIANQTRADLATRIAGSILG